MGVVVKVLLGMAILLSVLIGAMFSGFLTSPSSMLSRYFVTTQTVVVTVTNSSQSVLATQTQPGETINSQPREQLIMAAYDWTNPPILKFTLTNLEAAPVTIGSIYLAGSLQSSPDSNTISAGSSASYTIAVSRPFTMGAAYTLKVITQTGGVFAFSVIAGSSG